jgi:hypothetical protein
MDDDHSYLVYQLKKIQLLFFIYNPYSFSVVASNTSSSSVSDTDGEA